MERAHARLSMCHDLCMRIKKLLQSFYIFVVDLLYVVIAKIAVFHKFRMECLLGLYLLPDIQSIRLLEELCQELVQTVLDTSLLVLHRLALPP